MPPKAIHQKGGVKGETPSKRRARKQEEDDGDYVPEPQPDSDSENEEFYAQEVEQERAELAGEVEVEEADGTVGIAVMKPAVVVQPDDIPDEEILAKAREDKDFATLTASRKIRFRKIIDNATANSMLEHQSVLDFSDHSPALKKVPKRFSEVIRCEAGNYIHVGTNLNGSKKVRAMTPQELAEMGTPDSTTCACKVCKARRDNSMFITPEGRRHQQGKNQGSSGSKDWGSYGPGRTL